MYNYKTSSNIAHHTDMQLLFSTRAMEMRSALFLMLSCRLNSLSGFEMC